MALKIVGSSPIIHPILFRKRRMKMRRFRFLGATDSATELPRGNFDAPGGCAAEFPPTYPLCRAGNARPLALPMGELSRLKAVTERVYAVAYMEKMS